MQDLLQFYFFNLLLQNKIQNRRRVVGWCSSNRKRKTSRLCSRIAITSSTHNEDQRQYRLATNQNDPTFADFHPGFSHIYLWFYSLSFVLYQPTIRRSVLYKRKAKINLPFFINLFDFSLVFIFFEGVARLLYCLLRKIHICNFFFLFVLVDCFEQVSEFRRFFFKLKYVLPYRS